MPSHPITPLRTHDLRVQEESTSAHELCEKLHADRHDIPQSLIGLLQDALTCRAARDVGAYHDDNHFAGTVRGLEIRLKDLVGRTSQDPDVARLLKHLSREQGAVLTFLYRPGVPTPDVAPFTGLTHHPTG